MCTKESSHVRRKTRLDGLSLLDELAVRGVGTYLRTGVLREVFRNHCTMCDAGIKHCGWVFRRPKTTSGFRSLFLLRVAHQNKHRTAVMHGSGLGAASLVAFELRGEDVADGLRNWRLSLID
jgi:hypothetical protein